MYTLIALFAGIFLAEAAHFLYRFHFQIEDDKRKEKAREVLKKHGLKPQLYLATIGEKDPELRAALDEFSFNGYIITNTKDDVVGKLCLTAQKKPYLKLVSSRN